MIREAWRDLVDLFGWGGVEVLTLAPAEGAAGAFAVRSVIQFDADVMTWVAMEHLSEEVWRRHLEQLQERVTAIRRFRTLFGQDLEFAFRLLLLANLLRNVFLQEVLDALVSFLLMLVLPYLMGLLMRWLLQRLMKWAIGKVWG